MPFRRWVSLLPLLAMLAAGRASASVPVSDEYAVQLWDSTRGLAHNSISSIAQTRDGYLWIGSYGGVARFDGVNFTNFSSRNTPLFRDNVVQAIHADSQDRVWIGTGTGGLLVYDKGTFRRLTIADGLPSDAIWAIAQSGKRVWIGTQDGLAIIDGGRVTSDPRFAGRAVWALSPEADGSMWVGLEADGIARVSPAGIETWTTADGLPSNGVRAILRDHKGTLWAGTDNGLARLDGKRFVKLLDWTLENASIRDLAESGDTLWVGTFDGLGRIRAGIIDAFRYEEGMPSDTIRAVFPDRAGNVWLGTGGGGLVGLKRAWVKMLGTAGGLSDDVARAILESRDGAKWVATFGGGVTRFEGETVRVFREKDGLPSDIAFALAEDHDGAIWVGTRLGVARVTGDKVETFPEVPRVARGQIRAIYCAHDGTVWIGNPRGELTRYRNGRFEAVDLGRPAAAIFFITETRDGSIWAATHGTGLFRLEGKRVTLFDEANGMPTSRVWSLLEGRDGALWVGSRGGGLIRILNDRISVVDAAHGLFDDVVYHVVDDDRGRFWMSSNRGIFFVRKSELEAYLAGTIPAIHSVAFGRNEGMQNTECNGGSQPAGWRMSDGRIWFPTLRGVAIVDPDEIPDHPRPPSVILESAEVEGVPIDFSKPIELSSATRRLDFHYTGMSQTAPEAIEFRCRLVGYDEEWVQRGVQRVMSYSRLAPGRYRFEVSAANREGLWSDVPASIEVIVRPRWFETTAFKVFAAIGIVLLMILVYVIRVSALRRTQRELESLVSERTVELADANARLEALTLVDGLTGVANRRAFDLTLEREWQRGRRDGSPLALVLIDVDHFKSYNDLYGHQAGDDALRRVAAVLQQAGRRPTDIVARYGGEEFAIILSGADSESALHIAEAARAGVEALGIEHAGSAHGRLTITGGLAATIPVATAEPPSLIEVADKALYRAKHDGRNRLVAGTET